MTLSGCNGTRNHHHLVYKYAPSYLTCLAKWLSAHWKTKWSRVPILLQSLKFRIQCLFQATNLLAYRIFHEWTFIQYTYVTWQILTTEHITLGLNIRGNNFFEECCHWFFGFDTFMYCLMILMLHWYSIFQFYSIWFFFIKEPLFVKISIINSIALIVAITLTLFIL